MKTFTQLSSAKSITSDVNPGNQYPATGVMNHYTPIENIVTNVRNLFACPLGIVACIGEDGVSVKLHSTKFASKAEIDSKLNDTTIMRGTTLHDYICAQGLDLIKMLDLGQYWIVYFCPRDVPQAQKNPGKDITTAEIPQLTDEPAPIATCAPVKEMLENAIDELEMQTINEDNDDEEMEDVTKKKIHELITSKDKVKAAKQLELIVAQAMELPREYYFAGVKSKDGDESIALRWKYTKKRPHNKTSEEVRSLMNIFGDGKEAIWVGDFADDAMFRLPDEVKKLIENLLDLIGGEKTDNPSVFKIDKEDKKEEKKEDKKDSDSSSDDSKSSKNDDDDSEDDDSRGDNVDDLLK